jgi:methionyl-tRNA formyltransferase
MSSRRKALIFGYGEKPIPVIQFVLSQDAEIVGLVIPSNREGANIELIKSFAKEHSLKLLIQPPKSQTERFTRQINDLPPDLIVVCSYSMVIPKPVLNIPRLGCINLHGGLLPQYRGPHVLNWAIINNEKETGVTLHYMDEGLDTGNIIGWKRFPIAFEDDALGVYTKLVQAGAELLSEYWDGIIAGNAPGIPQDEKQARYYPMRRPEDGRIDWKEPALKIYNLVRALVPPWPGAFSFINGQKVTICRALLVESECESSKLPGTVLDISDKGILVTTGKGLLLITEIEIKGTIVSAQGLGQSLNLQQGQRFK